MKSKIAVVDPLPSALRTTYDTRMVHVLWITADSPTAHQAIKMLEEGHLKVSII
jgi:hypothetical protein